MERLICLLIGYCFGMILFACVVVKGATGKSIFTLGSKNPGMTNTIRVTNKFYGSLVLSGDLLKVVAAYLVCLYLYPDDRLICAMYTGMGAILGHNYPIWHKFKGGKGVAVTCMMLALISPLWGITACLAGLVVVLLSHSLRLGAIVIPTVFLAASIVCFRGEATVVAGITLILMIIKHASSLHEKK